MRLNLKQSIFAIILLVSSIGYSQNYSNENKNELKISMEMPLVGNLEGYSPRSTVSNGFSIRYLRKLFGNFSAGVVGSGLFCNQICDMNLPDNTLYTYSFKNYYIHAMLHYKIINKEHFMCAINGSTGLGYVDNKIRCVSYTTMPNISAYENTLSEKGRNFHYLFGAETAYHIMKNITASMEYKYDIKYGNHIVGVGVNYSY